MRRKLSAHILFAVEAKPGAYTIQSTVDQRRYIGSSENVRKRISHHFSYLRRSIHWNPLLQEHYDQHGESVFSASAYRYTDNYVLAEQELLNLTPQELQFNINPIADQPPRLTKTFRISNSQGGVFEVDNMPAFCADYELDYKRIMYIYSRSSRATCYKGWYNPDGSWKPYEFISPAGELIMGIWNLKRFCQDNGLSAAQMVKIRPDAADYQRVSHRGWKKVGTVGYTTSRYWREGQNYSSLK